MTQPLKLGFIGGGLNSAVGYTHYTSSHLDGLFQLEAGCFSRTDSTNQATAARYGVAPSRRSGQQAWPSSANWTLQ
ncbi:MAG: hypothetical protein ACKO8I_09180 [Cyanobacteriota bacterium]